MRLTEAEALTRLAAHDHGTFCTLHAARGVDAVPVVYVIDGDRRIVIPIDRVKPKAPGRLQRERNLDLDPRATLLIDHWDRTDWSRLWWVRAELRLEPDEPGRAESFSARLAERYPQYRGEQPFRRLLLLGIVRVTGWAATVA